ncbi:CLUMA_CG006733, isoform A [Clunio marinus]|uniref:CLUMA_CG006733, isoform A n=1 Tax=Clunio marinus TaxID=568069 RepID=A0A1J1HYT7_9DIPT|nr:CLUMA_CG006733, isoform A [Clunio marinus]
MSKFDEIFDDSRNIISNEEILYLKDAIHMSGEIQNELKSMLNQVEKLSIKFNNPNRVCMKTIVPGVEQIFPDYLLLNFDAVINEERQKHDFNSPQQHHKLQEINDGSHFTKTSTVKSEIINHLREVCEESKFDVDEGGGGDRKSFNYESKSIDEHVEPYSEFWNKYQKIKCEIIKIERELRSTEIRIKLITNEAETRAINANNYAFNIQSKQFKE